MSILYFDLDGVLRDFELAVWGKRVDSWAQDVFGKSVFEYLDENTTILEIAPPTEFLNEVACTLIKLRQPLWILSCQPLKWREYSDKWIIKTIVKRYSATATCIGRVCRVLFESSLFVNVIYVSRPEEKLDYLTNESILIDDNPYYDGNDKVVMVKRKYNEQCSNRFIESPEQMKSFIESFYFDDKEVQ